MGKGCSDPVDGLSAAQRLAPFTECGTLHVEGGDEVSSPLASPPLVTWDSEIFGPYFNVVVDSIGPETDFTLETNVKE